MGVWSKRAASEARYDATPFRPDQVPRYEELHRTVRDAMLRAPRSKTLAANSGRTLQREPPPGQPWTVPRWPPNPNARCDAGFDRIEFRPHHHLSLGYHRTTIPARSASTCSASAARTGLSDP
jgi:hypothetical protein